MQVRDLGSGALAVLLGNVVLKVISIYLLVFLAILVCRYLFMMLYSFSSTSKTCRRQTECGNTTWEDAFCP